VKKLLTALLLAFALGATPRFAMDQKPLTMTQVDDLVESGLDNESIAKVVEERGIDFVPSSAYLEALRAKGAMQALLDTLRAAGPSPLSKALLLHSLVSGMPGDRLAALVARNGIDFKPSADDLDTLRIAGADDKLCQAVQQARQLQAPPESPTASPKSAIANVRVYGVSGGVIAPEPIYRPDPPPPADNPKARYSGSMVLAVTLDAQGNVTDARVVRPVGRGLDEDILDTVKMWRFTPAMRGGTPVAARVSVELTFARGAQRMTATE
jgi:TonB family protein